MEKAVLRPIAHIESDFSQKFGIPRQSGLVAELTSRLVFEGEYKNPLALREIEGFSHLWLIWQFSRTLTERFVPTVRPPRLGGNRRVGVFASRSPYRPNGLGLSCVRLIRVEGCDLILGGADLLDGTPIFDVKPYIPLSDCHPEALPGYTAQTREHRLEVFFPTELLQQIPDEKRAALCGVLALDPRPGYEDKPGEEYGLSFAGYDIKFCVQGGICRVLRIEKKGE